MDYTFFISRLLSDNILLENFLNCLLYRIDPKGLKFRNPELLWASDTGNIKDVSEITIQFEYINDYKPGQVIQTYDLIYFNKKADVFYHDPNPRNPEINSIVAAFTREIRIDEILND